MQVGLSRTYTLQQVKNSTWPPQFKQRIRVMKIYPAIDLGLCSNCGGCIEIAPQVFRYNGETCLMEVVELAEYPIDLVDEAIKNCPEDCITWEG